MASLGHNESDYLILAILVFGYYPRTSNISFIWILSVTYSAVSTIHIAWPSYQIRKIKGCACAGNARNVFPPPRVSDPDVHHGTCVTHVPWCMPGSLISRWRRKRSRHSRRMRNPQFYVSGKRAMVVNVNDFRRDTPYSNSPENPGPKIKTRFLSTTHLDLSQWEKTLLT